MWWTSQNNCEGKGQGYIFFSEKKGETGRDKTACVVSLFKCLLFPDWAKLWSVPVPAVWRLHLPSTNQRRCHAHTQTHMQTQSQALLNCFVHTCSCKPQNSHTQTHTQVLKGNKSCRAGWRPPCFLSESFIFAPQQERRHHNSHPRYSTAVPTLNGKKKRLSAFVCCGYV